MPALSEMAEALKETALLKGLGEPMLEAVATNASFQTFEVDSFIIRDGDPAHTFHILRHGTVAVELAAPPHGRLILQTLHEGDVLGWSWLIAPHCWAFDGRATTLVRTIAVDGALLLKKMTADHEFGYQILHRFLGVMAARLTASRVQMLDLYAPRTAS